MAPGAATAFRWSDAEHEILVRLTNEQIQIEREDRSKEISWSRHWKNVSSDLEKHGYKRTAPACQGYWKRTLEAQKANEAAAGPRWDDSEHRILVDMTEQQLELERSDPLLIIPWPRHWKSVSQRLKDNGYSRSVEACSAYWILVQTTSSNVDGTGTDVEGDSVEEEYDYVMDNGSGEEGSSSKTSARVPTRGFPWTNAETENIAKLLRARYLLEDEYGAEKLPEAKHWTLIAMLHQQSGYSRTGEDCRAYWQRYNEGLQSIAVERQEPPARSAPESISGASKSTSVSSIWSPVNAFENSDVVSDNTSSEKQRPTNSQKPTSREGYFPADQNASAPFQNHRVFSAQTDGLVLDSETSVLECYRMHGGFRTTFHSFDVLRS